MAVGDRPVRIGLYMFFAPYEEADFARVKDIQIGGN